MYSQENVRGEVMRKLKICLMFLALAGSLAGCVTKTEETGKLKDLEFTVVRQEDIPEEMAALISEQEGRPFQMTYTDQGYLYIGQGYGEKPTTGYSVEVAEVYETRNAVGFRTVLHGPGKEEEVYGKTTRPYVVVKLEAMEKPVQFE